MKQQEEEREVERDSIGGRGGGGGRVSKTEDTSSVDDKGKLAFSTCSAVKREQQRHNTTVEKSNGKSTFHFTSFLALLMD